MNDTPLPPSAAAAAAYPRVRVVSARCRYIAQGPQLYVNYATASDSRIRADAETRGHRSFGRLHTAPRPGWLSLETEPQTTMSFRLPSARARTGGAVAKHQAGGVFATGEALPHTRLSDKILTI